MIQVKCVSVFHALRATVGVTSREFAARLQVWTRHVRCEHVFGHDNLTEAPVIHHLCICCR